MRRISKSIPSFFKILINKDFNRKLRLPPAFVKEWTEVSPEFLAQLRISSGEVWIVKLEKAENQNYYFTLGWSKFCEDLGLEIGEFVVFTYNGKTIFDVSVYGINGCQREITATNPVKNCDSDEDCFAVDSAVHHAPEARCVKVKIESEDEDAVDGQDKSDGRTGRYSRKLHHNHSTRLEIPKSFALSTGIAGNRTVNLQDSKSRLWPVEVVSSPRGNGGCRYWLTAGWNEFLVGNKVAVGSTVLLQCEVRGGSLLKAKVLNKGSKGRELFQSKSRKGRPSKLCTANDDINVFSCKEECVFF